MISAIFALPFELIVKIARADPEVWYQLYRFAPAFTRFAQSDPGRAEYIRAFTVTKILPEKTKTYLFGKLNSINDQPAVIWKNSSREWYYQGLLHRDNEPAAIYADGDQKWYYQGKPHRLDGHAVIYANGDQSWCYMGHLHRDDGPAVIWASGDQYWYQDGEFIK